MDIIIREGGFDVLEDYATISIGLKAVKKLDLHLRRGLFELEDIDVTPFRKDYDALTENDPTFWRPQFDISHWGLLGAFADGARWGGAALVFGSHNVDMLEERDDLAVLWDLRVAKDARGLGIGTQLWTAAEE